MVIVASMPYALAIVWKYRIVLMNLGDKSGVIGPIARNASPSRWSGVALPESLVHWLAQFTHGVDSLLPLFIGAS